MPTNPDVKTAVPRVLSDATQVVSQPDRYADRPHLVHHARLVLQSAGGLAPVQRVHEARSTRAGAASTAIHPTAGRKVAKGLRLLSRLGVR